VHSDGSREIGEEGIEESLLDEIVGKLINEGKLEKAASICTHIEPFRWQFLSRVRLQQNVHIHRQAVQSGGQGFNDREGNERYR
jgi:hypothetical protein